MMIKEQPYLITTLHNGWAWRIQGQFLTFIQGWRRGCSVLHQGVVISFSLWLFIDHLVQDSYCTSD